MTHFNRRRFLLNCTAIAGATACSTKNIWAEEPLHAIVGLGKKAAAEPIDLIQAFMQKYKVPQLSMAVSFQGKLKATFDFGESDSIANTPVASQQLYRIASISKPITSVALMKLIESGKLTLDHCPFAEEGLLRKYVDLKKQISAENTKRLEAITISHLLHHTCGGWGNKSRDPMFVREALEFDHKQLIHWAVETRPLEHAPGTDSSYSNFGYCLLGRVIEELTDDSYESHVQKKVLNPMGVSRMQVGEDALKDRQPDEVVYYGQKNEDPYGKNIKLSRMDAHGGWIASATDLVRFAVHADGFKNPRDVIQPSSIKTMTATTPASPNYACGWAVNKSNNWWHSGSLPGTSSILARINDQHCWAVLANTRSKESGYFGALDKLPWAVRRSVAKWPAHDLFEMNS
ncbi:MAG: penicillin-binding protein [Blastopirellula sp.]|nr:MAG: penicillin-binding protein [Blastopirellula sp.]